MKRLIGFAGPARVGKSTSAYMLCKKYDFEERAFGDPIKEAMISLTGLDRKYFYDQSFKHNYLPLIGMSPRKLMQLFGTEFVRDMVSEDFFVKIMYEKLRTTTMNQVISDVRFAEEAEIIRHLGGTVVILSRDSVEVDTSHRSEEGITVQLKDMFINLPEGIEEANRELTRILIERDMI